jgi:hydroxymethylpyrimidine pyrophosphatase-like HAD family hydrolase
VSAPRLIATDLDGTLLRPDGTVSERTAAALVACERAGVEVVFVTARPPRWLAEVAPLVGGHGVAICANGAAVVDVATLGAVEEHGMGADVVADLARRIREVAPGSRLAVERAAGFALETRFDSGHPAPPGSPVVGRIEDALTGSTLKLLVRSADAGVDLDDLVGRLAHAIGDRAVVSHSGAVGLAEIAARGVTKASTLARWSASRGVASDEVWAVGDAPNDLPMLAWAGTSFAVANAHRAVLAAVDRVLPSNADDGVATLLERAVGGALGSRR